MKFKDFFIKSCKEYNFEAIAADVRAYILKNELNDPSCHICLDCRSVLMKSYFFPFRASGKIESALEFELDSSLPVKQETLFTDWIFGPRVGRGAFVNAGCVEKEFQAAIMEAFTSAGLTIADITSGSSALLNASARLGSGSKLILDIGRERTVLLCSENGLLRNRDLLLQGVDDILTRLESNNFNYDSAYRTVFLTDFTQDAVPSDAGKALKELKLLISQISNYVHIYHEKTGFTPDVIEICGEGSEIKGIERLIEDEFDARTVRLLSQEMLSRFEDNSEANNAVRSFGLAFPGRNDRFCFLSDEFKEQRNENYKVASYAVGWLSLLLFSLLVLFGTDLYYKSKVVVKTEARINAELLKTLPGLDESFSHAQNVSILKSRINDIRRKLSNNSDGAGSALEALRMIHATAPAKLNVTLDELTLDPRRIALSGSAGNFKDVESFRTQLEKSKFFKTVSIKGASADKKTKQVRFTIELLRKPLGE